MTNGQKKGRIRLKKLTKWHGKSRLENGLGVLYLLLTEGQNNLRGVGHGRNYERSGETDADEAGWEAATAFGSEAGADCGGGDPAFCRARV
jgi:hypothetical protein